MDISAQGRFHIAPGYDPTLPATWVWEDRSADVNHVSGGVTITGGRADETTEVEASSGILEVDNAGGHYCSANPNSRWYGRLSIGCPARWGTISGAEAWTANTSNGWGTPDVGTSWTLSGSASDWSSSGGNGLVSAGSVNVFYTAQLVGGDARNGEATFVASVPALATGSSLVAGLIVRRATGVNQIWFCIDFGTASVLGVRIKRDVAGVTTDLAGTPTVGTYSAGQRLKGRCVWDGQDLRMRIWTDGGTEPTTWTATATDNQCAGSGVGLQSWRVAGNTNTSPLVFTYDTLEVEAVEITGFLPELPVRWDPTATVSWTPLEIAGITRLLSQGADEIESPIHRQLVAQPMAAYWPFEDDVGAVSAASAVARGFPATIVAGVLGQSDCPPGASAALLLSTSGTSRVFGQVVRWPVPQDGYAAMCYGRFPSLPASGSPVSAQKLMEINVRGTVVRWVIYGTSTGWYIEGYATDDTLVVNTGSFAYGIDPTKWFAIQLETGESGGTVNWALIWHQVGSTVFSSGSGSYSGTADLILTGALYAPVDGTLVSHFWLGDDLLNFVDATFMQVSAAYPGETDTARIARVFTEKNIPIVVEPGTGEQLGPQRLGQALDVARTAEAAGLGILYETGAGYGYRSRVARYNRAVWAALAIGAAGDVADDPQPAQQDLRMRNYWKVTRDGGGSAVDSDPVHIARYRRRPDTVTIGIYADGRLLGHASWRVHLGTWDEYRWPQIVVDLTDRPALLTLWRGRPYGPRITISGIPAQGPIGALADLVVEGWRQEITSASWRLYLACSPARPYDVGVYNSSSSKYDSNSTTLEADITSGATVIGLATVQPDDVWSLPSGTLYDIGPGGEQMTVLTMTLPSSVAVVDGGFETGSIGTWSPTGGTLAASSAQAHRGTWSALLTVSGSPVNALIRDHSTVPASVGQVFTARMWVRCSISTTVTAVIDFYNGASYITSGLNAVAVTANTWTEITTPGTAPATTTRLEYGPTLGGSPANGTTLFIDDLEIIRTDVVSNRQVATVLRSVNAITKAHSAGEAVHLYRPARYAL